MDGTRVRLVKRTVGRRYRCTKCVLKDAQGPTTAEKLPRGTHDGSAPCLALFREFVDGCDVRWPCGSRSAEVRLGYHNNRPKLVRIRKQPCTIRTFPLSDSTPQRLPSAIAIFTFHITFFAVAGSLQATAPLVSAYLKSRRDVFSQREGASSSHLTRPPTRPQPRQSPVHPSPPCNTCHVI